MDEDLQIIMRGTPEARATRIAQRAQLKPFGSGKFWKTTVDEDVYIERQVKETQPKKDVEVSLSARLKQKQNQPRETSKPEATSSMSALMNQKRTLQQDEDKSNTLILDNVPPHFDEDDIRDRLGDFNLRRVNVVRRTGMSIGKAFVVFGSNYDMIACQQYMTNARWEHYVISWSLAANS